MVPYNLPPEPSASPVEAVTPSRDADDGFFPLLRYLGVPGLRRVIFTTTAKETGANLRETATDIGLGTAYGLGNGAGRAQANAGRAISTVKWVAIGGGVIIGGLVALKALQTVREAFDNG